MHTTHKHKQKKSLQFFFLRKSRLLVLQCSSALSTHVLSEVVVELIYCGIVPYIALIGNVVSGNMFLAILPLPLRGRFCFVSWLSFQLAKTKQWEVGTKWVLCNALNIRIELKLHMFLASTALDCLLTRFNLTRFAWAYTGTLLMTGQSRASLVRSQFRQSDKQGIAKMDCCRLLGVR